MSFLEHELAAARVQSQEMGAILKAIVAWHDSFTGRGSEFSDEGPYSKFLRARFCHTASRPGV